MVKSSKKALAVLLAVACLITFMPAMASQSFAAKKLTVKPAKKTIYVKKSVTLKANQKVKWSASKASLKVVKLTSKKAKSVKVTGKKAGKAVVTAKVGKQTKKVTITVKKAKAAVKKTAVTAVAISADNAADPAKTLAVGTKLRAAVTPANATVTYQWKADGTAIAGATDATFTVTTAETGKAITVEVTGIDNFEGTAVSTATAKVATAELTTVELKAYNVTTGKYDGQAITKDSTEGVGTKLKAVVTTDPTGADVATFQWYRSTKNANGTDATTAISGATSSEYTLTKEDIGTETKVFVVVTPNAGVKAGTNLGQNTVAPYKGSWVSKYITVSGDITPFVQANGKAVNSVVYGTKVTVGGVPADANVTYQWYRGSVKIAGATSAEYTTVKEDKGTNNLKVVVTVTDQEKVYTRGDKTSAAVSVTDVAKVFNKAILSDTDADKRVNANADDKDQVYPTDEYTFTVYALSAKGVDEEKHDFTPVDYVNGQIVKFTTDRTKYQAAEVKDGQVIVKKDANGADVEAVSLKVGDKLSKKAIGTGEYAGSEITSNEITITSLGRADELFTKKNTKVEATKSVDKTTKLTITLPENGFDAGNTAFSAVVQAKKNVTDLEDTTWETVGTYTKVDKAGEKTIAVDLNTTALEKYQTGYTFRVVLTTPNYFGSATVGVTPVTGA